MQVWSVAATPDCSVCSYVCVCVCVYVCMHACMYVCVCVYVCMYDASMVCVCMYVCMCSVWRVASSVPDRSANFYAVAVYLNVMLMGGGSRPDGTHYTRTRAPNYSSVAVGRSH
jgi:hypothetical protein